MDFLSYLEEIPYRYMTTVPYALPFIWAGAILGHSFIGRPMRYNQVPPENAPVTRAGEVPHQTFTLFFMFEALFLAMISGMMVLSNVGAYLWFVFGLVIISLFLQRYYLKPIIFNRVEDFELNRPLPTNFHQRFYMVLEIVKFLTLIGLGTLTIRY